MTDSEGPSERDGLDQVSVRDGLASDDVETVRATLDRVTRAANEGSVSASVVAAVAAHLDSADGETRGRALAALSQVGQGDADLLRPHVDAVVECLTDDVSEVVYGANQVVGILYRQADDELAAAASSLADRLEAGDDAAARALSLMAIEAPDTLESTIDRVTAGLNHADAAVRRGCAETFAELAITHATDVRETAMESLFTHSTDEDAGVRRAVVETLGYFGDDDAVIERLREVSDTDDDADVRATANEGLRRWVDPENAATEEEAADVDADDLAGPT
jgi:HEAT repeat protein